MYIKSHIFSKVLHLTPGSESPASFAM